ncbi:MAG: hypothetical protein HYY84_18835 [Deltaproteobacteria bacterium]|nr:hypothetical protein [Deltaproteobacteria bacterium]
MAAAQGCELNSDRTFARRHEEEVELPDPVKVEVMREMEDRRETTETQSERGRKRKRFSASSNLRISGPLWLLPVLAFSFSAQAQDEEPARPRKQDQKKHLPKTLSRKTIRNDSQANLVISRQELLSEPSKEGQLTPCPRVALYFERAKTVGIKVFSVRPESLFSKLGIKSGDVIRRINGEDIDSPDKAFDAWRRLKDASSIQIELSGGGTKKKLNYQIQ